MNGFKRSKIKMTRWRFLFAFFLVLGWAGRGNTTPLTTGADFLLMTTGARPDAMGQAFNPVADDINTLSSNPAGLGNIRLPEIGYGYESFVAGIQYDFVGAAVPIGSAGVLGLGYIDMGTAPFNSTANPATPSVSVEDRAFIAGWGRSFYNLHVGISGKYILRQLDTAQSNGWGIDLGVRYRLFPYLTLASSLMNLGPGIQFATLEPLPTVLNTGAAWTVLEQPNHTLNLAANVAFSLATNTQQFGLGAEYWYQDKFALRAGYLFNSLDTNFNPDGFAAGAGVQVSFLEFDYAFQPFNTLGMVHRVSGILRWDGPWISGGEPNAPKYVEVIETPKAMEIHWQKSIGPVKAYEVLVQPMDGGKVIVSEPVINPVYYFYDFKPGTLYKVSVRTIGESGARSYPSREVYTVTLGPEAPVETVRKQPIEKTPVLDKSVSRGVDGLVDAVGLRLSWEEPAGFPSDGYNIYRRSPGGSVQKVTQEPKHNTRVWLTDVTGLQGWEWIVTAVGRDGQTEKMVGSYLWFPSQGEIDSLVRKPTRRLTASPQLKRRLYLDWDADSEASGYDLLVSRQPDNVYELFKELDNPNPEALLQIGGDHKNYYFIVAPVDAAGKLLDRSITAVAEFHPWNEPGD